MIGAIVWFVLRFALSLLFYATPIIGFWVASSLAAYLGAPTWVACTVGALLFPIIPGVWEFHTWAWRDPNKKAWFTTFDRISLKTFAIGLTFLVALLYFYPQTAFVALSTRGDWMLGTRKDERAENIRRDLFAAANGLEWLYRTSKKNPYKDYVDAQARQRTEKAEKQLAASEQAAQTSASQKAAQTSATEESAETTIAVDDSKDDNEQDTAHQQAPDAVPTKDVKKLWPWKQTSLHPVVASMPPSAETSISSVARYIAEREKDPVQRIKALHDYVADRVVYDTVSFHSGNIPNQDAQTTFKKRKSVCAGYANLLSALGAAIDEKIVVVVGDARDRDNGDKVTGMGHAWNAAKIDGHWYLIDACWDSGYMNGDGGYTKQYKTDYLLAPPTVMIEDHFPEEETWQLLAHPLSQGEFLRQPMLSAAFQSAQLTLVSPTRARNEVGATAVATVTNPEKVWLFTALEQNGQELHTSDATNSPTARLVQQLPGQGTYRMNIFMNRTNQYGQYVCVGSIDFVNR